MTAAGWIFLALAWGGVTTLVAWCLARVLRDPVTREPRASGDRAEPEGPLP